MTRHADAHRPHERHDPHGAPWWKRPHKDWRLWVAVGLMLAAMLAYVLTLDESLPPGGPPQQAVPAAP